MIRLHETIEVDRSAIDCYRYLQDFSTIEQWDPGVYRARKLDAGTPEVGSRFEVILQMPLGRRPMQYTIEALEPERAITLRGEAGDFSATDRIEFQPLGEQRCRISYRADLTLQRLPGPADKLIRPWLQRVGRHAVQGLATALRDPTPPDRPQVADRLRHQALLPAMRQFTEQGYLNMPDKGLSQFIDGQTVLITGPTSGLGLAASCQLARQGARVLLVGRDAERLAEARRQVREFSGCESDRVAIYRADLSSIAAIDDLAGRLRTNEPRIDVLINNAGALFGERAVTADGIERCLAINLLAPWRLTEALLPTLRRSRARVINVASGGMYLQGLDPDDLQFQRGRYDGAKAYARCKRALVAVTRHWADQSQNAAVRFYSMHPGWAATPGVARSLPGFNRLLKGRLRDPRMGADTICWLASSRSLGAEHNGQFWFDRRPQVTAIAPGTEVSRTQLQHVLDWLRAPRAGDGELPLAVDVTAR